MGSRNHPEAKMFSDVHFYSKQKQRKIKLKIEKEKLKKAFSSFTIKQAISQPRK
jgi:hypothetical protein